MVNVLGTVLPELLILYLFFFYFSGQLGDQVLKIEAVAHHAYPVTNRPWFFWPHFANTNLKPRPTTVPHRQARMPLPFTTGQATVTPPYTPTEPSDMVPMVTMVQPG